MGDVYFLMGLSQPWKLTPRCHFHQQSTDGSPFQFIPLLASNEIKLIVSVKIITNRVQPNLSRNQKNKMIEDVPIISTLAIAGTSALLFLATTPKSTQKSIKVLLPDPTKPEGPFRYWYSFSKYHRRKFDAMSVSSSQSSSSTTTTTRTTAVPSISPLSKDPVKSTADADCHSISSASDVPLTIISEDCSSVTSSVQSDISSDSTPFPAGMPNTIYEDSSQ